MIIYLKKTSSSGTQTTKVKLIERLPAHLHAPCILTCTYKVSNYEDYYLLSLNVKGTLAGECQRCSEVFTINYDNDTLLALCPTEHMAEQLMSDYEAIAVPSGELDLIEVITDELHLYSPKKHEDRTICSFDKK